MHVHTSICILHDFDHSSSKAGGACQVFNWGYPGNGWFRGFYQYVEYNVVESSVFFCVSGILASSTYVLVVRLGSSGKTCRNSRKTWAMPGVSGWRRRTGWVQSPQVALPHDGFQCAIDLRLRFQMFATSRLATKPSFGSTRFEVPDSQGFRSHGFGEQPTFFCDQRILNQIAAEG